MIDILQVFFTHLKYSVMKRETLHNLGSITAADLKKSPVTLLAKANSCQFCVENLKNFPSSRDVLDSADSDKLALVLLRNYKD
jgi:hypothetical protein